MSELISVVMPTFNSRKYIKYSIQSVLSQSYKNLELIVVDDCSTDNTIKIIRKFKKKDKRVKIFKTNKNSGVASVARNIGIKKAKGDYYAFLDSDDIWHADKLISQINELSPQKLLSCTACEYQYGFNGPKSGKILNFIRIFLQYLTINKINNQGYNWLYIYNPIILSSVLINKKIFKFFKFNESNKIREDLDLWLKLTNIFKNSISFNKKVLVTITRRDKSLSSDKVPELNRIIGSISNDFIFKNNYKFYNYFILGIAIKTLKSFLKNNLLFISKNLKKLLIILGILYFLVFYSPLFWHVGNKLLYYDTPIKVNNVVVFSGHGNINYINSEYQLRYKDIKNYLSYNPNINNIYLLGRLQEIPEQKLIEALLINDGIDRDKINVIYKEFENTKKNIVYITEQLNKKNINEIVFFTSPYHTFRSKLIWSKYSNGIKVNIAKSKFWPEKNNFFSRSKNKKIIIYEYLSIIYNYYKNLM
tara:strand:+ start:1880 stop:3307 length:1428 start_codon:yes stop_codon:yes gene_type:complete